MEDADADDGGNAIIEFIFVAVIVLVPLVYLIAAVATVQRNQLAMTQAAREAGRAYATSDTPAEADLRVRAAVRLALTDQGLPDDAVTRFVAVSQDCATKYPIHPELAAGSQFAVCVTRHADIPGVPTAVAGERIPVTGRYIVHVDDFRDFSR